MIGFSFVFKYSDTLQFNLGRRGEIEVRGINKESELVKYMFYITTVVNSVFKSKLGTLLGNGLVNFATYNLVQLQGGGDVTARIKFDGVVYEEEL